MSFPVFYRNVFRQLKSTGSIAPSSRFLAKAMLRCLQRHSSPRRILEAGPGTGPFTKPLGRLLNEGDQLDLYELNDEFVEHLKRLMDTYPSLRDRKSQINLFHQPVQAIADTQDYDVIISSLPFNNFEPDLVQEILEKYQRILKPGGSLSFFEYAGVRHLKKSISSRKERERIQKVGEVLHQFLADYEKRTIKVLFNLPPSLVHECVMG